MRPRADRTEQSAAGIRQFMERLEARVAEINTDPVQRAEHDRESELNDAAERALQSGRAAEARGKYAAAVGITGARRISQRRATVDREGRGDHEWTAEALTYELTSLTAPTPPQRDSYNPSGAQRQQSPSRSRAFNTHDYPAAA